MYCSYCGTNNPDNAYTCARCGGVLSNNQPTQQYTPKQYTTPQQTYPTSQQTYPSQQPYYPAPVQTPAKGLSIASMVMGIISLLIIPYIAGALAIIFGSVAKNKGSTSKMATAGLIMGIIGIAFALLMQIFFQNMISSIFR